MVTYISSEFVERRLSSLSSVPSEWEVSATYNYVLDLKMCHINSMSYNFKWGDESKPIPKAASLIEQPSRILKLDISLNELSTFGSEGLVPLWNLRYLDASLNRLVSMDGMQHLGQLHTLNLSHNLLPSVGGLKNHKLLVELNLGMNEIKDIRPLPSLMKLRVLYLNNNQLTSLEGIQSLPHLRELYVQRNILKNLVPLMSCLHLVVLNASENDIESLRTTVDVVSTFKQLKSLSLHDNPIEKDPSYQTDLIRRTSVITLDNVNIKPLPQSMGQKHAGNLMTIKDAAEYAFHEQLKAKRQIMEENVRYLQKRILALQNEYYEYEIKMKRDKESCLGYMDGLSTDELKMYETANLRDSLKSPENKPWERPAEFNTAPKKDFVPAIKIKPRKKEDYRGITDPDEVLRLAYNELAKDRTPLDDV